MKVKNKWTGEFYDAGPDGKRWKMTEKESWQRLHKEELWKVIRR